MSTIRELNIQEINEVSGAGLLSDLLGAAQNAYVHAANTSNSLFSGLEHVVSNVENAIHLPKDVSNIINTTLHTTYWTLSAGLVSLIGVNGSKIF